MIKALAELAAILPPPTAPCVTLDSHEKWIELFDIFGTRLPEDFVQFHRAYGEGYFFSVSHKMSANLSVFGNSYAVGVTDSSAMRHASPKRLNELRRVKETRPKRVPYPLFCEPLGLLPWGNTSNDVDLCWQVRGDLVDNWRVVALRVGSGAHQLFDCGMARFLAGIIGGKLECPLMPKGWPGRKGVGWAGGGGETFAAPPAG